MLELIVQRGLYAIPDGEVGIASRAPITFIGRLESLGIPHGGYNTCTYTSKSIISHPVSTY